jgi:hypothetical protein
MIAAATAMAQLQEEICSRKTRMIFSDQHKVNKQAKAMAIAYRCSKLSPLRWKMCIHPLINAKSKANIFILYASPSFLSS